MFEGDVLQGAGSLQITWSSAGVSGMNLCCKKIICTKGFYPIVNQFTTGAENNEHYKRLLSRDKTKLQEKENCQERRFHGALQRTADIFFVESAEEHR